jgi:hypothetical protein
MLCVLFALGLLCDVGAVGAAADCIVVSVVVNDRIDGAGDEKVLSFPRPVLIPHPAVPAVPPPDDAACDCAVSECVTSVHIVAAVDLFPIVGGWSPSSEDCIDSPLRFKDDELIVFPVGTVENDW